MSAAEAAAKPTIGIEVGPLFGQAATIRVQRTDPAAMPWLHLVTMSRMTTLGTAPPTGDVGITPPIPAGGIPDLGAAGDPGLPGS
jgi:hypothetical protein